MRKLIAVLCAVALMLTMATAFANPSIGDTVPTLVEAVTDQELSEGAYLEIRDAEPDTYENATVAGVVEAVNDPEQTITLKEAAEALELETETDLDEYDFVSKFYDLVLVKDGEASFDDNGEVVSGEITAEIEELKGEEGLEDYQLMLINPTTGDVEFIELGTEFDSTTGEVNFEFPFLGTFALIQK